MKKNIKNIIIVALSIVILTMQFSECNSNKDYKVEFDDSERQIDTVYLEVFKEVEIIKEVPKVERYEVIKQVQVPVSKTEYKVIYDTIHSVVEVEKIVEVEKVVEVRDTIVQVIAQEFTEGLIGMISSPGKETSLYLGTGVTKDGLWTIGLEAERNNFKIGTDVDVISKFYQFRVAYKIK